MAGDASISVNFLHL